MRRQIIQAPTAKDAAYLAAELTANRLRAFPDLSLSLPTGNTPLLVYQRLRQLAKDKALPTRQATFVQIDEYLNVSKENSFHYYLKKELSGIEFAEEFFWNSKANPKKEISRAKETFPRELDYILLGLGTNGHIAFCEPGCPLDQDFYISELDEKTIKKNQTTAQSALTMGISYIKRSREIVLLVLGEEKADILARALEGKVDPQVPLSLIRDHPRLTVIVDPGAASKLQDIDPPQSSHATLVVGCRQQDGSFSSSTQGRINSASRVASKENSDLVILSGGVLFERESEAGHMANLFPDRVDIPILLEEAADRTSRHIASSLPLLACLNIQQVTLVTSWWHIPRFWFMQRCFLTDKITLRFRPAWSRPFLGMRGQGRLHDEIAAMFWAKTDGREALRWIKKRPRKKL